MRPSNLVDQVHDFGINGDIVLNLPFNIDYATISGYANNGLNYEQFGVSHYTSNILFPNQKILNAAGQQMPPATGITLSPTFINLGDPEVNNTTASVQVALKGLTPNSGSQTLNTIIDIPNKWTNRLSFWTYSSAWPFTSGIWGRFTNPSIDQFYTYKVFQKSIAIIEDITTTPIIANNQTKSIALNDLVRLNKGKNRGSEVSSQWVVQVRDSSNNFITATQGTDYQITFGTLGSNIIELKFLQNKSFRIIDNCFGYTSSNNPFSGTGYGGVNKNEDSTFYSISVENSAGTTQDLITLPKIIPQVIIQNQVSTNPVQTGYTGATITINSILDLGSGSYFVKDLVTGIQTPVTMTEAQWIQELNTRTNITLEIKNKTNNNVIVSKNGLGPHVNITLPEGSEIITFKTILK